MVSMSKVCMQYVGIFLVLVSVAFGVPNDQHRRLYDVSSLYLPSTTGYGTSSYSTTGGYPVYSTTSSPSMVYSSSNGGLLSGVPSVGGLLGSGGFLTGIPIVGDVLGSSQNLLTGIPIVGNVLGSAGGLMTIPTELLSLPMNLLGSFGGIGASMPIIGDMNLLGGGLGGGLINAPLSLLGLQSEASGRRLQEATEVEATKLQVPKVEDVATALKKILDSIKANPEMTDVYQEMLEVLVNASEKAKIAVSDVSEGMQASPAAFLETAGKQYMDFLQNLTSGDGLSSASKFLQDMYNSAMTAITTDQAKQGIQSVADHLTNLFNSTMTTPTGLPNLLDPLGSLASAGNLFQTLISPQ